MDWLKLRFSLVLLGCSIGGITGCEPRVAAPTDATHDAGSDGSPEDTSPHDGGRDAAGDTGDSPEDSGPDAAPPACGDGYVTAGAGCAPIARPIAPLSTARVTSQTPTLHWELADGYDGAHVEICQDRSCTMIVTAFDVVGSSGAPTSSLAAGIYYWRIAGMRAGVRAPASGVTWQFEVGSRTAPHDTSWGVTPDFDGDGHADVAYGSALVVQLRGDGSYRSITPNAHGGSFAGSLATAGDLNGDGFVDFVVDHNASLLGGAPMVAVFFGGASGPAVEPSQLLALPERAYAFAGDVNGDGYADLVAGDATGGGSFRGSALVAFGSAAGLSPTAVTTITSPAGMNGRFGTDARTAGDVDGDGFGDVIIGAPGDAGNGRAFIYRGSALGLVTPAEIVLTPSAEPVCSRSTTDDTLCSFGQATSGAGDVDGDGLADVVVGEWRSHDMAGRVSVFGGSSVATFGPLAVLEAPSGAASFGYTVTGLGDIDGDGYDDLMAGAPSTSARCGAMYVYFGNGLSDATRVTLTLPCAGPSDGIGALIAAAGDIDHDGHHDLWLVGRSVFGLFGATSRTFSTTPEVSFATPSPLVWITGAE